MRTMIKQARAGRWNSRLPVVALAAAICVMALCVAFATPASAAGLVTGTSCSPSCDLWAETGTMPAASLPGAPAAGIVVWGYNTTDAAVIAPGGPTLIVNQGDAVSIILHNKNISSATTLMIAGQPVVPDTTGVTAGNSKTYSFAAGILKPGTYLYEAGLTADGPRQVAMGLYGALIVRPVGASLQAYAAASTAFTDEAVLVLSEIDPAFNAAPATFEMSTYAPKYWLINGKVFPNTDTIATSAGNGVLLRYVNAGLQHHSMGLLGLHQTMIAADARPAANQMKVVAETVPTGGTLDTLVTMPASPPANAKYALFEAAMHQDNSGASTGGLINFGGMLTFLTIGGASTPAGPITSAVSLSPNPSSGPTGNASGPVTLSATISGAPNQAEYFVDVLGTSGSGCQITGSLTSVSVTIPVSGGTAPCVNLTTLSSGNHTFYVHGHNANGWGAYASAVLNLDKSGPVISNMSLTPSLDNGLVDVVLQATASDVATGNQNVTAAEYNIDGGAATPFTIAAPATTVSLNATIAAATVNALSEGNHAVNIRAQDALGNWGALGTITLKVDKTGPGTSGVSTTPNPTNGTFGVQVSSGGGFYQRIDATIADPTAGGVNSNIVAAEYFIDTVGANGTGGAMFAVSGTYNGPNVPVYGAAELYAIAALAPGNHTIFVHGKDAAGNWGPTASTILVIDKTAPVATSITRVGATPTNATSVQFLVTFSENVIGVTSSNFTLAATGVTGASVGALTNNNNNTWTVTVNTGSGSGTLGLSLANATGVTDLAHNALSTTGLPLSGQTYAIDKTAPTISNVTVSPNLTNGAATIAAVVTAADNTGGSDLNGGEYWLDGTTTPAAGRVAFGGATSPVTVGGINVSTLANGNHNLRVRVKDVAGNFSTVFTRQFTVYVSLAPPTGSKAFAGAIRGGNGTQAQRTTTLTITLFNSNGTAITGVGITDNLPQPTSGTFTVVSSATTCGGTTSTANTNRRLLMTGGTIPANGNCTVTATVRLSGGATNGPYTLTNTIAVGGVTSTNAGSNSAAASAVLTVNP